MRVIAGSAKSLPLKTISGMKTRPTQDKIKETLFNMIQSDIPGSLFLDLCSGSGAIGIEALSRGASFAIFVEKNRKSAACIKENLAFTRLAEHGKIMVQDAVTALKMLEKNQESFDIVFMDPPYEAELEIPVLTCLKNSSLITEQSIIIIEAKLEKDFSSAVVMGYEIMKEKRYKTNKHVFLRLFN